MERHPDQIVGRCSAANSGPFACLYSVYFRIYWDAEGSCGRASAVVQLCESFFAEVRPSFSKELCPAAATYRGFFCKHCLSSSMQRRHITFIPRGAAYRPWNGEGIL